MLLKSDPRITPLSKNQKQLMKYLSTVLNIDNFIMFGGTALNCKINPKAKNYELDIGINYDNNIIKKVKTSLKSHGFEIIGKERLYFINMNSPVTMVFAKNSNYLLDISFMNNFLDVGQFDIESLFYRYPQLDCVDRFGAIEAYKRKTIKAIYGLNRENPYLLINRVICLSAKYNLSLSNNNIHKKIIRHLKKRLSSWKNNEFFHGKMSKISHYSHILKAIARSKSKVDFIKDLANTGVLEITFPEIQRIFKTLNENQIMTFENLKTKEEVAKNLIILADQCDKEKIVTKFKSLNLRKWDIEDKKIHF